MLKVVWILRVTELLKLAINIYQLYWLDMTSETDLVRGRDRDTLFRNIVQASLSAAFHHCSSRGQELILALMQRDPTPLGRATRRLGLNFLGHDRELRTPPTWTPTYSERFKLRHPFAAPRKRLGKNRTSDVRDSLQLPGLLWDRTKSDPGPRIRARRAEGTKRWIFLRVNWLFKTAVG